MPKNKSQVSDVTEDILKEVTQFYLDSRDFNGIPTRQLEGKLKVDWSKLCDPLQELISKDLVGIIFPSTDVNPHVIRVGFETTQIEKLNKVDPHHACVYPRPKHLATVVDKKDYSGEPFKLEMALGMPQLAYHSFELSVLEFYRNDPRYAYQSDDINGNIYYDSEELQESDKVLLQTFGFSYDENYNRAVAVFNRYLSDLSSEHQLIWKAKQLNGDYKLHPDYYRNTVIGDWGERVPICSAFLKELFIINQMANAMGRPPLFHQDFGEYGEDKPQRFGFLIRTTLEEFNNFVLLLDKMLSDNINKKFFQNEVPYVREIKRKDGKIEVQNKGTLQIIDEWTHKYFNPYDWEPWDNSINTLKEIRRMRQKPAHAIDENIFDQRYFKEQRELIIKAYSAVRTIRLLFANHPMVKSAKIDIPDWLQKGLIWTK